MSLPHDPGSLSDTELLARIGAGALDASHPEVRRRLHAAPDLHERLLAMQLADCDLESIAEVVADAGLDAPDVDMEALIAAHGPPAIDSLRPRLRPRLLALAMASILVVAVGVGMLSGWFGTGAGGDSNRDGDPLLGSPQDQAMQPQSANGAGSPLDAGQPFRWTAVPDADYYRLQVRDGAGVDVDVAPDELLQPQWLPTSDNYQALPQRFDWRVRAYDASDRLLRVTAWVQAARSPG